MIWRDLHPFRARFLSTHIEFLAQINKRSGFSIFITSAFTKKLIKKIVVENNFENFDFRKNRFFRSKNFWSKKCCLKIFGRKNMFGRKNIFDRKILVEKIFGPKFFEIEKISKNKNFEKTFRREIINIFS